MEIRPILSAMLKQKVRALLIAAQIAITLAVTANALDLIAQRRALMDRDLGLDVPNLINVSYRDLRSGINHFDAVEADLRLLRSLPGVEAATVVGSAPLGGGGNMECFSPDPENEDLSVCHNRNKIDEQGLKTLGVELIAGRDFTAADIERERLNDRGYSSRAIVTEALADALFPEGDAVGKTVYSDGIPVTVVGVIAKLSGPWVRHSSADMVMLQPTIREVSRPRYLVRTAPGERDRLMAEIEAAMLAEIPDRLLSLRSQEELVARTYRGDRSMVQMLLVVIFLLVSVTAVGIIGLASSSVTQRTKQIGTRRALGARKRDILRYFLIESSLVATVGIAVGAILCVLLNVWLVNNFSMPRLDWQWLLLSAVGIGALCVSSTLPPARRATLVPPSVATRTL